MSYLRELEEQRVVAARGFLGRADDRLRFEGSRGERIEVAVLDEGLVHVRVLPDGQPRIDRTWAIVGPDGDVPVEGRNRDDLSGLELPPVDVRESDDGLAVAGAGLRLLIRLDPFAIEWLDVAGHVVATDHPAIGYRVGPLQAVTHTMARHRDDHYYGVGEVSGELDHRNRRYRLDPMDSYGYDAQLGDPLYKHFPFAITLAPSGIAHGVFYDTGYASTFDFGAEKGNYQEDYRYFEASGGDLDFYFIYGPTIARVIERFTALTGRPPVPPRWSLGYLGSGMAYTEASDAPARLIAFGEECRRRRIRCEMFHVSSGWSLGEDGKRYVFEWSRLRFPDPAAAVERLHELGIRTAFNVKPALLESHPQHADLAARGGFVRDARTGVPFTAPFWGGTGSHVDFTGAAGRDWWRSNVRDRLLANGADAVWDDNNEFEIRSPWAQADGDGRALPLPAVRPVETLLMARASHDALLESASDRRPFVLTRSAGVGTQRYAQTWSGDNVTSWHTLRWNVPMGLSLAMSGFASSGHDVGGFGGPAPDPELLVRWVEAGIFHPRFCIHSWNDDGTSTEPWTHPSVWPPVRNLIHLRYRLIPYLYSLFVESAETGHPIHRPLVYEFPGDEGTHRESFDFMLGPNLLLAPVLEPGVRSRTVRLPAGIDWIELSTGRRMAGGSTANVEVPLARPALFAPDGAVVPLSRIDWQTGAEDRRRLVVLAAPPPGRGDGRFELVEDDGESFAYRRGAQARVELTVRSEPDRLELGAMERQGAIPIELPYSTIVWLLPPGERRPVSGLRVLAERSVEGGWRAVLTNLGR